MNPADQTWLWTSLLALLAALVGSLITLAGIFMREKLARTSSLRVERLKLYDKERFEAYKTLYEFVAKAYALYWPPDDPASDFKSVMKDLYFKHVKTHFPYFEASIREKLGVLEGQYQALFDPSLAPKYSPDEFFGGVYLDLLNQINAAIEKRFEAWVGD